jgi:hypothetical protein
MAQWRSVFADEPIFVQTATNGRLDVIKARHAWAESSRCATILPGWVHAQ